MKFSVRHVGRLGRLGELSDTNQPSGYTFETPVLALYARGGNVPHITHEVLQMVTKENLLMLMPLTTMFPALSSIESFGRGVSEFVGLKEYPSYITPQDPAVETPSGYNVSNNIAIWTKNGKRVVNPPKYMAMIEAMKPDMYLSLCDGDTNSLSSKKRVMKSVTRTLRLFKDCYQHHYASDALKHVLLLAPLEGGYDLNARKAFLDEIVQYNVFGYVLDGLHTNGREAESIKFESVEPVTSECLRRLPEDRLRVVHGAWSPATLLQLVAAGFDVFDTSLPYLSTERNAALTFPFEMKAFELDMKFNSLPEGEERSNLRSYETCLENDVFREDFQPVLKDCSCITCKQHTRAYIHHLLKSQELLGKVLIMIHNLHHYLEFFKTIRRAIESDSLDALHAIVQS